MLACTCLEIVFARPNDIMILVLTVRGVSASLPKSIPILLVCRSLAGRRGLWFSLLLPEKTQALGFSTSIGLFQHQLASSNIRRAEYYKVGAGRAKSPVLEYRTRNEVTEGNGKARAQILWELGKDAAELCGAKTSHPPSPTTT